MKGKLEVRTTRTCRSQLQSGTVLLLSGYHTSTSVLWYDENKDKIISSFPPNANTNAYVNIVKYLTFTVANPMPFEPPVTTQFRLSSVQHWDILSLSDDMTVAFGILASKLLSRDLCQREEVASRSCTVVVIIVILPIRGTDAHILS